MRTHTEVMSRYYGIQAPIYDATRWTFLFGRRKIVEDLKLQPGDTVLEVGCGTGSNFERVMSKIGPSGRLVGIECSTAMRERALTRIRVRRWSNVVVLPAEYGGSPVLPGQADAVLFSYSLSMIPDWLSALRCAGLELRRGGRLGVVDFCATAGPVQARIVEAWLGANHVQAGRNFHGALDQQFVPYLWSVQTVPGSLWSYFRFVGGLRTPESSHLFDQTVAMV